MEDHFCAALLSILPLSSQRAMVCEQVADLHTVTSVIDGLKILYRDKLRPLELAYKFPDFVSPALVSGH